MANINDIYQLVQYRANKSGFLGNISPNDFNLIFPRAEIKYFNSLYAQYYKTQRISDALSRFFSPLTVINMATAGGTAGQYTFPSDLFHVDAVTRTVGTEQYPVVRVEKDRLANHLSSKIEAPTSTFPIYTEYKTYLQFYPLDLATANLVYLKAPTTSVWGYTLNGVTAFSTLVGGSLYTNGTYTNVVITGGTGSGARATIVVSSAQVTSVTITTAGNGYVVGNVLSANAANIGGTGSGFAFTVTQVSGSRPIYNPLTSVQPEWNETDLDNIIYLALQDIAQNMRDGMLQQFAQVETQQAK
jgi:hypothetical protein